MNKQVISRIYLGEKDRQIIQATEHALFRANLDGAIAYLKRQQEITYEDFLKIHEILFSEFYPWAGQDRSITAPDIAVSKADILFAHPWDIRKAIDFGLQLAASPETMRARLGEILGLFAYGHPFLEGNGRTMLVIHAELCHRAGFAIAWERTEKRPYLEALSAEIRTPGKGVLGKYLTSLIIEVQSRKAWGGTISALPGLDGQGGQDEVLGAYVNTAVTQQYEEFTKRRDYTYR